VCLVGAASLVLVSEVMTALLHRQEVTTHPAAEVSLVAQHYDWWMALGIAALVLAAWGSRRCGVSLLRQTRARRALNWHWRRDGGLAIIDFTPAWDHTDKPILSACRGSRKLLRGHFAWTMSQAACLAAAGTLATQLASQSWLAECVVFASVLGIVSLWPTTSRLCAWCASFTEETD
ncbi:MAG: hypothetical protein AAF989_04365, partial [Planctomycetota bacterium]